MLMFVTLKDVAGRVAPASVAVVAKARAIVKAAANRRAIHHLSQSDDRLLKDIGLTRGDVLAALDVPFYTDPSGNLIEHASPRTGIAALDVGRPIRSDGKTVTSKRSLTRPAGRGPFAEAN